MFGIKTGTGIHRAKSGRRARAIAALLALALIGGMTIGASSASAGDGSNPTYNGYGYRVNGAWFGTYKTAAGVIAGCLDPGKSSPDPGIAYATTYANAPNSAYLLWKYSRVADGQTGAMLEHAMQVATDLTHQGTTGPEFSTQVTNIPSNQAKYNAMQADAAANRGPYTVKVTVTTQPTATNTAGAATVSVVSAAGNKQPNLTVTIGHTGSVAGTPGTVSTGTNGTGTFNFTLPNSTSGTVTGSSSALPPTNVAVLTHSPASDNYQRLAATGTNSSAAGSAAAARPAAPNGQIRVRKLDATTGAALAGATFQIHRGSATGAVVATLVSGGDGYTPYTSQPVGTYVAVETAAPAGFNRDAVSTSGAVTSSGSATITMRDSEQGKVSIHKTDAQTGAGLAGAHFRVETTGGAVLVADIVSTTGTVTTGYLGTGVKVGDTVVIRETAAPANYLIATTTANAVVTRTGAGTGTKTVANNEQSQVSVHKTDAQTGAVLAGATFQVLSGTTVLATGTTNAAGNWTSGYLPLKVGTTVTIKETAAPATYLIDPAAHNVVTTRTGTGTGLVNVVDNEQSKVSVHKTDAQTGAVLAGATFQVLSGTTVLATGTTNAAGNWTSGYLPLKVGTTVTIKETAAPATYLIDPAAHNVVTTRTGTGTGLVNVVDNEQSKVSVHKTDAQTGVVLAGATFQVLSGTTDLATGTTDAAGNWTSGYLPLKVGSSVQIKETKAPVGYQLITAAKTVITTRTGTGSALWSALDPRVSGNVTVIKRDSVTGAILPGVTFTAQVRKIGTGGVLGPIQTVTGGITTPADGTEVSPGHYVTSSTGKVTLNGTTTSPQLANGDQITITEFETAPGYVQPVTPMSVTGTFGTNGLLTLNAVNSPQRSVQITKTGQASSAPVAGAGFTACYLPATGRVISTAERLAEKPCTLPAGTGLINPVDKSTIDPKTMYLVDSSLTTDTAGKTAVSAKAQYAQIGDQIFVFETVTPAGFEKSLTAAVTTITATGWDPACSNTVGGAGGTGNTIGCAFVDQETAVGSITKRIVLPGTTTPAPGFSPAGAHYLVRNVTRSTVIAADSGPTDAAGKLSLTLPGSYLGDQVSFTEITAPFGTALNSTPILGTIALVDGAFVVQVAQDDVPVTLATTATTPQGKFVPVGGGVITDTVTYTGLLVGTHYTVTGALQENADGTAKATNIVGHTDFIPTTPNGTVAVTLTTPATEQGQTLVVFEALTLTGSTTVIASHADINDLGQSVYFPSVTTTAANQDTDLGKIVAPGSTVVDQVRVCSVQPDQSYVISGSATAVDRNGASYPITVTGTGRFDADDTGCHTYPVNFLLGNDVQAGSAVVFAENLFQVPAGQDKNTWVPATTDVPVGQHADATDAAQTVYYPAIGTTATDGETGGKNLTSGGIVDVIAYSNLQPGVAYTATGTLQVNNNGTAVDTGITATSSFTPTAPSGTVKVSFTVPASLAGKVLVPFESVALASTTTQVAEHNDITDLGQTVYYPVIGTTAGNGDTALGKTVTAGGTLTDVIAYRGLQPGQQYTATGEFQLVDGTSVTPTGLKGAADFTPTASTGTVTVTFTVPAELDPTLLGASLVAYETVKQGGVTVAIHADATDAGQTVIVPKIGTTAANADTDLGKTVTAGGKLTDVIAYQNLTVGTTYTATGEFQLVVADKVTPTGIKGTATFTPTATSGTVTVTFGVPASLDPSLLGQKLVAFEKVSQGSATVAIHADVTDAGQTVIVPKIGTTASNEVPAFGKTVTAGGSLVDVIAYSNLTAGTQYTASGEFQALLDGKVTPTGIKGTATFTPKTSSGTTQVTFTVPFTLPANVLGRQIVAFETVKQGSVTVAVHQDMTDTAQAVEVPMVTTTLTGDNGSKTGIFDNGTLTDKLSYKNFQIGTDYVISSELRIKDGTVDGRSTGITATTHFTPTIGAGVVNVTFHLDPKMSTAATYTVVSYETIALASLPGTPIVYHQDIDNLAETITLAHSGGGGGGGGGGGAVVAPPHSGGGGSINTGAGAGNTSGHTMILLGGGLLVLVLMLLAGAFLLIRRRRSA